MRPFTCSSGGFVPVLAAAALALGGCSGGGSDDPSSGDTSVDAPVPDDDGSGSDGEPTTDGDANGMAEPGDESTGPGPIAGEIARYGVIAVGDENGAASGDALASFARLSERVGVAAFGAALSPASNECSVVADDGSPGLLVVSRLYVPVPDAVSLVPIDAGETVLLSSAAGDSWLELQGNPPDAFYTRPSEQSAPSGTVPDPLVANVAGAEFPAFTDVPLPDVVPLTGVSYDGGENITADTRFTWQPSGSEGARVRIESATAGGFFLDDGVRVSCLVPDTGEYVFSPETREALGGAAFEGMAPDISRVAIDSVQEGDTLLLLVRESFAR